MAASAIITRWKAKLTAIARPKDRSFWPLNSTSKVERIMQGFITYNNKRLKYCEALWPKLFFREKKKLKTTIIAITTSWRATVRYIKNILWKKDLRVKPATLDILRVFVDNIGA